MNPQMHQNNVILHCVTGAGIT